MQYFKSILVVYSILFINIYSSIYISEVINNTNQNLSLAYPSKVNIKILNIKSIDTGIRNLDINLNYPKGGKDSTLITLPAKTIISLQEAIIPIRDGNSKEGISIGIGNRGSLDTNLIIHNIKKKCISQIPVKNNLVQDEKGICLFKEPVVGQEYILEITTFDKLDIYPKTSEKLEQYINPGKLSQKDFLHQAIINDSPEDIKNAVKLGADVNIGLANQPPLLFAILTKKYQAAKELLNNGANPNITYSNEPLLYYVLPEWNVDFMFDFINHGLKLSDDEKALLVDKIMFRSPYNLNDGMIQVLKKLNYDIRKNFEDSDLSKNKWYNLLVRQYTGTRQGVQFGHAGMPNFDMVDLYIKYGANPNQIFILSNKTTWNPLLLIIDNFLQSIDEQGRINSYYYDLTRKILKLLLDAGADINKTAEPHQKKENSLSYALNNTPKIPFDIIEFLVDNGASIEMAIKIFIENGGSPNMNFTSGKNLLLWTVEKNNPEAVKILLKVVIDNYSRDKALKFAISKGYEKIIEILMAQP
ncbi:MAG TPA: ankyrin repeat domain-containing protein [Candidatus Babeliales bacterium]|nr:ankyrin repeat domain-containing protein [Candidatus Babeliales bacterium]